MFIDKVFEIVFAFVLIFFIPLMIFAAKSDQNSHIYAADAVEEFINKSCATGIISSTQYEEMITRLDATGVIYDVYLIHSNEKVSPKVDDDGNIVVNSTIAFHEEYRNGEIYEHLFPEDGIYEIKQYYLNRGDYIRLVVQNKTPTMGTGMLSGLFFAKKENNILISRGGYVGNEVESKQR